MSGTVPRRRRAHRGDFMSAPAPRSDRPDYGIDAPGVIRNLFPAATAFLAAAGGFIVWGTAAVGFWSGEVYGIPLAWTGFGCFIAFSLTGLCMIWYSKAGKLRMRERILNLIVWKGDEAVLDVGCGRGLMLIGAARRLTGGKATGIDIWQAEDLSGNRPEATLENARREGVADRVEVRTADMRQMPFPNASFDVIVSCAAIHNIYNRADREQAVREIARVPKPGGRAAIDDIRHHTEYTATFAANGCPDIRRVDSRLGSAFATLITIGSLRPAVLVVTKSS